MWVPKSCGHRDFALAVWVLCTPFPSNAWPILLTFLEGIPFPLCYSLKGSCRYPFSTRHVVIPH